MSKIFTAFFVVVASYERSLFPKITVKPSIIVVAFHQLKKNSKPQAISGYTVLVRVKVKLAFLRET